MKWILIIFVFFSFEFNYKNNFKDLIIGEWKGVSKVMIEEGDTVDYTLDQKGYL